MAKRSSKPEVLSRKQLSRRQREERQKRLLYALVGVAAFAVIAVIGFGIYREYIVAPASPVAVVNGEAITTRDYQQRVRYDRFQLANQAAMLQAQLSQLDPTNEDEQFLVQYFQQQIQQVQSQSLSVPVQVLDDMIDEELIRQEAARRGITAGSEEVQEETEQVFGYERNTPTPVPTPTTLEGTATPTPAPTVALMTREEFENNYAEYVLVLRQQVGMGEEAFRALLQMNVLRRKLQDALAEEVPTAGEQIHARHILVETEEEAKAVLVRLEAGEDFAALANELSLDTATEDGDLGWFARGQMVTAFEEAALALEDQEISDPVETTYGWHIIQLLERDPNRPFEDDVLEQKKAAALSEWLADERLSDAIERYWSSDKVPS